MKSAELTLTPPFRPRGDESSRRKGGAHGGGAWRGASVGTAVYAAAIRVLRRIGGVVVARVCGGTGVGAADWRAVAVALA